MFELNTIQSPTKGEVETPQRTDLPGDLVYVDDHGPGLRRRRAGSSFAYYDLNNRLIRRKSALARIRYIHPEVVAAYLEGNMVLRQGRVNADPAGREQWPLTAKEKSVLEFLRRRLSGPTVARLYQ